ncbi:recombination protein NinG, partial [bacterium]|nr:recombination protein NinG [bacterium]
CGIPVHWKKADAGHFIKRQFMSLRFNEKNVSGQCRRCNWLLQGNDINYAKGLVKKYGEGILEQLVSTKNRTVHMGKFELKHIADYYRMKFNQIKKLKGL